MLTACLVGLLGGVHCVGMCGGIVTTLTMGLAPERRRSVVGQIPFQLAYNLGRIAGYTIAGAFMGGLGALLLQSSTLHWAQRVLYALAALFMVALGLYLGGWWRGLTRLEQAGGLVWRRLEPFGRRLLPIDTWWRALGIGLIWAWLPCGLVYSVLILALGTGGAFVGAATMFAFGLGTLPNLLGIGLLAGAAARYAERRWLRQVAGVLVIGFGLYGLWQLFAL
ncbi:MAG: sulfite exporter TauE/SafE family protein [Thiohalocapsa sp.]